MSALFVGAPFAVTASRATARCWAGRPEVLARLHRLEQSLITRAESSLDVVWANLGAGKSHALYHLDANLSDRADAISLLIEMPEQPKHFIDLYRQIIGAFPLTSVAPILLEHARSADVKRAARTIQHGDPSHRDIAMDWLGGGRPHIRDLREATGIGTRIEDDGAAGAVLADLVSAFAARATRFAILIDEFQRLSTAPQKARAAILANLRSVFSKTPAYFSVVLAVASRMEDSAMGLLPGELRTLMGMKPAVSLPAMDQAEAFDFLVRRLAFFRPEGYSGDPHAPFGAPCLKAIVDVAASKGQAQLIPRTLLQACGYVYDDLIGRSRAPTVAEVTDLLNSLRWEA